MVEGTDDDESLHEDNEDEEVALVAEDYGGFVLSELGSTSTRKRRSCVSVVGSFSANVCGKLAVLLDVTFTGCRPHRLSLATKALHNKGENDVRSTRRVLTKVQKLVG